MDDDQIEGLERLLARLMLRGLQVSAACLFAGLAMWIIGARVFDPARMLTFGLIALMATPMLRVAVSVAEAIRLRDWFFVLTTAAVAMLLSISVVYAFAAL